MTALSLADARACSGSRFPAAMPFAIFLCSLRRSGDGGFHVQVVRIPPNFDAPVHTHDHPEVFMVLEGSCAFNGTEMRRLDTTVVESGAPYGFTSGPDGVMFLAGNGNYNAIPHKHSLVYISCGKY